MSEFICPVLISTDLAGRIFFLKASCCDSEVSGGRQRGAWCRVSPGRYSKMKGRCSGREVVGRLQSLHYMLYANISLPLNGTAQRGGERGAVSRK